MDVLNSIVSVGVGVIGGVANVVVSVVHVGIAVVTTVIR